MSVAATAARTQHKTVEVDGLDIFYREGGDQANPAVLLLHGFPTSSFMFRNLIPALADEFHLVAPDYPSYGQSSFPTKDEFDYTFERFYEIVLEFVDTVREQLRATQDSRPEESRTRIETEDGGLCGGIHVERCGK